jgi:hypothetical protein
MDRFLSNVPLVEKKVHCFKLNTMVGFGIVCGLKLIDVFDVDTTLSI